MPSDHKPFHESIVDAINSASSVGEMIVLGQLIEATKVPKGHQAIIEAWTAKSVAFGIDQQCRVAKSVQLQITDQEPAEVAATVTN